MNLHEVQEKLKSVGLGDTIDFERYLQLISGGIGAAVPVADLVSIDSNISSPANIAYRESWAKDGEDTRLIIGFNPIAFDVKSLETEKSIPDHLKVFAKYADTTVYFGSLLFELTVRKDVNGFKYIHLEQYTPTMEDISQNDWYCDDVMNYAKLKGDVIKEHNKKFK